MDPQKQRTPREAKSFIDRYFRETKRLGRLMMASESVKTGGLALHRSSRGRAEKPKQKNGQEMLLFSAFVVLLMWALYVAFDGVSWPVIAHTVKALLAAIW